MTDTPVTWLRPRTGAGYTDGDALNDIHALLTGTDGSSSAELRGDIGVILTRTGRAMVASRDIDACVTDSPHGRPVALVDASGITVTVRQEPAGTGLLVEITSTGQASAGEDTTVTLDGRCLHHPCPTGTLPDQDPR
jgi:hypothetical protein